MKSLSLAYVMSVYTGSNGEATQGMYNRLAALGPQGEVALNLFRAQKCSERAKVYRGNGYRHAAYERKQWSMDNLVRALRSWSPDANADVRWGWGIDAEQPMHRHVLYIDLPQGQVSFHTERRGAGPDFHGTWDGVRDVSPQRICSFVASVLDSMTLTNHDGCL